ncbi:hypothetical protein VTK73DRAFT_5775 [Phialemonium thermophilum]|uniref:RING-type domain-containing protein n=1 Tax=Phialemonium thermophilum TaxID=223376 RepID=A0ABR3WLU5_9PEZI
MCYRLIRHFKCQCGGSLQSHRREWIVRCSTPNIATDATVAGSEDQPCLQALDTQEEWYDPQPGEYLPCDLCSGQSVHPPVKPTASSRHVFGRQYNPAEFDKAVTNYSDSLLRLFYSWLTAVPTGWHPAQDHQVMGGPDQQNPLRVRERMEISECVVEELSCKEFPDHGWIDYTAEEVGCQCDLQNSPFLSNFASEARAYVAEKLTRRLDHWNVDEVDYIGAPHDLAQFTLFHNEKLRTLQRSASRRIVDGPRFIPVMEPFGDAVLKKRLRQLTAIVSIYRDKAKSTISELFGDRFDQTRQTIMLRLRTRLCRELIARVLADDTGLMQERAVAIMRHICAQLLQPSADWQVRNFSSLDGKKDWAERIAYTINNYWAKPFYPDLPYDTFLAQMVEPSDFRVEYLSDWQEYMERDRARATRAKCFAQPAPPDELQRLMAEKQSCPICGEEYGLADGSTKERDELPVVPIRCLARGAEHYCGQSCLVRQARQAEHRNVPPRCVYCRLPLNQADEVDDATEESDSEEEEEDLMGNPTDPQDFQWW